MSNPQLPKSSSEQSAKNKSKIQVVWNAMTRTKSIDEDNMMETRLKRCLTAFDLTLLGIGNMTGSGIYVLTGAVIRKKSGPAICISFLIAGVTAFLNSLCYAELGSRIPKAGSAYTYTYVAGGEFLAFVIGWSVILEYVLSVSSVARGWSGTLESMLTQQSFNETIDNSTFVAVHSEQPDVVAFVIVLILGGLLALGPKMSVNINSVITISNILVLAVTSVVMYSHPYSGVSDFASPSKGGFMPFHFAGVLAGAGTCFYSFIGFDAITVSSEEAANPRRDMPIATAIAVSFVTVLFVVCSFGLVLFQPWYLVDTRAAFTSALRYRGMYWGTFVTGIGSIFGISASLFTSMYALPRVAYAMSADGLIPSFLSYVHPTTQVPLVALFIFGSMAATLALLLNITTLADFLSIGTLMAYTIVSANVCILRYKNPKLYESRGTESIFVEPIKEVDYEHLHDDRSSTPIGCGPSFGMNVGKLKTYFKNLPILKNVAPGKAPVIALMTMMILMVMLCILTQMADTHIENGEWFPITFLIVIIIGIAFCIFVMVIHEQNENFETFKVPFVPFIPCICILLNVILIIKLSVWTWIRFAVWTAIGLVIYFTFGAWHSLEGKKCQVGGPMLGYHNEQTKLNEVTEYQQPVNVPGPSPLTTSEYQSPHDMITEQ